MTPPDEGLEALLERAGVEARLRPPLALYGALVLAANRRFNLTGAKSGEELVAHLADSLSVVAYIREGYIDIGSGAGFPAIPVAIATGMPVTLIEATTKKARFLETVLEQLGLRGRVVAERAEAAAHREVLRERFASGTARGLAAASTVAELLLPFIAPGGVAVLQRGRLDGAECVALEDASLMLGGRVESECLLGGKRRIVVVRKEHPTPSRFPRRAGIPEKRPLCSS
ncbi:MAG TPA: 16S rRNA (guanine(527)-N(7))-methyltransferase RsmG [Candidatus Cybelea sp.]|nr:16S rRNA (guanine(527)-N(7))-methyltransferase RsmG [Candidatus Cybelea sp.]